VTILNVADAPRGANWLCTTNVPFTELADQAAVRVIAAPGANLLIMMTSDVNPMFDLQTVYPFLVIENPSMLGPSATNTLWWVWFLSVKVILTIWPCVYLGWLVVRITCSDPSCGPVSIGTPLSAWGPIKPSAVWERRLFVSNGSMFGLS
jgi:hypothetical protein